MEHILAKHPSLSPRSVPHSPAKMIRYKVMKKLPAQDPAETLVAISG